MTVLISEKHLKKSDSRKTYSDKDVKGFALRTTPNGVFTFYYQHLNKKTGKRDWHKIGDHPDWSVVKARNEARRLAGLVADDKDIKQIRRQKAEQDRVGSITFQQLTTPTFSSARPLSPSAGAKCRKRKAGRTSNPR